MEFNFTVRLHSMTKILPLFVYPLGISIILCFSGLLSLRAGKKRIAMFSILLSIIVLWGSSTRVVAEFVLASLEHRYPPLTVEAMPSADAIVVLGGMTRGIVPGTGLTDLDDSVDRLVHGARLFKAGKAPIVILTGGGAEGYQPESEGMQEFLTFMGIPPANMVLESKSRNTWQNGVNTKPILNDLGINKILLVTSASHLRRAQAVFENMGVSVIPAATDYQLIERPASIVDWLPDAAALAMTTKGIKEYLGWWVYSFKQAQP